MLDGVNCTASDYANSAAGIVVPADEAPSGHTTLFFAFSCMCEVTLPPHHAENVFVAPTIAALDLQTLSVSKVGDTPQGVFNTNSQVWPTVSWIGRNETGTTGRLLVSAPHW
eukprot:COSAG02_NODE_7442_length_3010_cov_99.283064_5_plen_112_part_00